jgi:hypothetical protein
MRRPLLARALAVIVASACAGAGALGLGACIDDLPDALSCPPSAQRVGTDCLPTLEHLKNAGRCLADDEMSCLSGARPSCACQGVNRECPTPEPTCFPDGDCPQLVHSLAGDGVHCLRIDADKIGAGLSSAEQCLCGCAGCVSVCDGRGPIYGILNDGTFQDFMTPLALDIADRMPSSGLLGVYVRVRGFANAIVGVAVKNEVRHLYYLTLPVAPDFVEQAFTKNPFFDPDGYSWTREEDKPTALVVVPLPLDPSQFEVSVSLFELDCIVPFVLPN